MTTPGYQLDQLRADVRTLTREVAQVRTEMTKMATKAELRVRGTLIVLLLSALLAHVLGASR